MIFSLKFFIALTFTHIFVIQCVPPAQTNPNKIARPTNAYPNVNTVKTHAKPNTVNTNVNRGPVNVGPSNHVSKQKLQPYVSASLLTARQVKANTNKLGYLGYPPKADETSHSTTQGVVRNPSEKVNPYTTHVNSNAANSPSTSKSKESIQPPPMTSLPSLKEEKKEVSSTPSRVETQPNMKNVGTANSTPEVTKKAQDKNGENGALTTPSDSVLKPVSPQDPTLKQSPPTSSDSTPFKNDKNQDQKSTFEKAVAAPPSTASTASREKKEGVNPPGVNPVNEVVKTSKSEALAFSPPSENPIQAEKASKKSDLSLPAPAPASKAESNTKNVHTPPLNATARNDEITRALEHAGPSALPFLPNEKTSNSNSKAVKASAMNLEQGQKYDFLDPVANKPSTVTTDPSPQVNGDTKVAKASASSRSLTEPAPKPDPPKYDSLLKSSEAMMRNNEITRAMEEGGIHSLPRALAAPSYDTDLKEKEIALTHVGKGKTLTKSTSSSAAASAASASNNITLNVFLPPHLRPYFETNPERNDSLSNVPRERSKDHALAPFRNDAPYSYGDLSSSPSTLPLFNKNDYFNDPQRLKDGSFRPPMNVSSQRETDAYAPNGHRKDSPYLNNYPSSPSKLPSFHRNDDVNNRPSLMNHFLNTQMNLSPQEPSGSHVGTPVQRMNDPFNKSSFPSFNVYSSAKAGLDSRESMQHQSFAPRISPSYSRDQNSEFGSSFLRSNPSSSMDPNRDGFTSRPLEETPVRPYATYTRNAARPENFSTPSRHLDSSLEPTESMEAPSSWLRQPSFSEEFGPGSDVNEYSEAAPTAYREPTVRKCRRKLFR